MLAGGRAFGLGPKDPIMFGLPCIGKLGLLGILPGSPCPGN